MLSALLVGCSPFPIHYTRDVPKFSLSEKIESVSYFDTNGYFEEFCPTKVPEQLTYRIDENIKVTIRVRGDWLDLKPIKNGVPFKLAGEGLRELDYEGYTQSLRTESLANNTLILSVPGTTKINIQFDLVKCTGVTYDAI